MMSGTATLVLLCRRPQLREGKRRLAASLGDDYTFNVAQALLQCALEDLQAWQGQQVVSPSQKDDTSWFQHLLFDLNLKRAALWPQSQGNLGQRINALDQSLYDAGHLARIYIGSDSPILDASLYSHVDKALQTHDMVLVPASDGGVVLMATKQPWPDLRTLPWSEANLCSELSELCLANELSLARLDTYFDVDNDADLLRAMHCLEHDQRPARQHLFFLARQYFGHHSHT